MKGTELIRQLTGEPPVFPGHPIVTAMQIMHAFPSLDAARVTTQYGWSAALGSQDVCGAGCHVAAGLRILKMGADGVGVEGMIKEAERIWVDGKAGGHEKNVPDGSRQAQAVEPHFREIADRWLAGRGPGEAVA